MILPEICQSFLRQCRMLTRVVARKELIGATLKHANSKIPAQGAGYHAPSRFCDSRKRGPLSPLRTRLLPSHWRPATVTIKLRSYSSSSNEENANSQQSQGFKGSLSTNPQQFTGEPSSEQLKAMLSESGAYLLQFRPLHLFEPHTSGFFVFHFLSRFLTLIMSFCQTYIVTFARAQEEQLPRDGHCCLHRS